MQAHDRSAGICIMDKTPVTCPFCNPAADEMVAKNVFCYARWDRYPVSKGHLLVIPFRHVADYFSRTIDEKHAVLAPVDECKEVIEENCRQPVTTSGSMSERLPGRL